VLNEMISHVPIHSKQVGAVFFKGDKLLGLEMFDSPDSWNASYEAAIKKYGYNLTSPVDESVLDVKVRADVVKKKAKEFIRKIIESNIHDKLESDLYESGIMESKDIVGEYVRMNGRVIYLVALTKDSNFKSTSRSIDAAPLPQSIALPDTYTLRPSWE